MAKPARPVQVAGLPSPSQSPARATLADEDIPDHINLHIRGQVPSMPPSPCRKTPGSASSPDADAPSPALEPLYSLNEFKQMWEFAEEDFGVTTEEIEDGNLVRGANNRMNNKDSVAQTKAQYGRILPEAMDKVFREVLELKPDDVFVDIGHGIGNTMMQASYTFGCESRGVEVVENRNFVAQRFRDNLKWQREVHQERDGRHTEPGRIRFQHGRLEEPRHREFLTVNSKYKDMGDGRTTGTIKAFANNFNGVFADRCARAKQTYFLDHYISGIFALMKPGSIMVTLHPLLDMPPPLSVVTANRKRHKLKTSRDASFYELDQSSIGVAKDSVSWSQGGGNNKKVAVYRYKRVKQSTDEAVFLCSNLDCPNAQSKKPIPATKIVEVAGEQLVVVNHCDCGISEKSFRQRRPVDYTSVQYGF